MTGFVAAARRHPGVTFVALPCVIAVLTVMALWPAPHTARASLAASAPGIAPVAEDRTAPDFSRPLVTGGGELTLREFRGNVVVVNFWASWCAACRDEVPRLRVLARGQHGVVLLGVDAQDTRSGGQAFLRRLWPGYRSVFDPDGSLLRAFGSIGVPSTFVVDRSGRIRYQAIGVVDPAALRSAVARVAR